MSPQKFTRKSSSVSELLSQVKYIINKNFDFVAVQGEVSNLSRSSQGHYYLSLSDSKSLISAVVFRGDSSRNTSVIKNKDGDVVDVVAEINLYRDEVKFSSLLKSFPYLEKEI